MGEYSMISVVEMCANLKSLTILELNLSEWNCASDYAFEVMKTKLSQLSLLSHLDLNISHS
jgi:hypothetical protein